ncbi:MAG: DUF4405 domain-containing protein [Candidatus Aminicenantes bacterium]|nr:DUF4405 domain-containing protein [Candidatus Aminicenantes bacterium]
MKKTDWKYLVDVLMFLSMIGIILLGLLMAFAMKSGPMVNESEKYFLGLHRHQWGTFHLYLSLFFIGTLFLHLVLEWSWIKGKSQNLFKTRWKRALLVLTMLAIIIPFIFWIFTPKYPVEYSEFGRGQGRGRILQPEEAATDKPAPPPSASSQQLQTKPNSIEEEQHEAKKVSGWDEAATAEIVITGRMTLREVEKTSGVRAEKILIGMDLPRNLSKDEPIGRLRRRYRFTLPQMRDVIAKLMEKN